MKSRIDYITDAIAGVMTLLQPDEYLRFISLIFTCISVTLSIAFTIYKWYKTIKSSNSIEIEEIKNAVDDINSIISFLDKEKK